MRDSIRPTKYKLRNWKRLLNDSTYNNTAKIHLNCLVKGLKKLEPDKRYFLARHYLKEDKARLDEEIAKELGLNRKEYRSMRQAIEKELHPHVQHLYKKATFNLEIERFVRSVENIKKSIHTDKLLHGRITGYSLLSFSHLLYLIKMLTKETIEFDIVFDAEETARNNIEDYDSLVKLLEENKKERNRVFLDSFDE